MRTKLLLRFANWVMSRRPPDLLIDDQDHPYMLRWHAIPRNPLFGIYVHKMLRDDYDGALHDHPKDNCSILLQGGYVEHLRNRVEYRSAGQVIFRQAETAHRIELLGPPQSRTPAVTLFLTGPKRREWGFYERDGWRPHYEVLAYPLGGKGVSQRK